MIELYINDEKVDFQLEEEKTVEDLYKSLDLWSNDNKNVMIDLLIDGKSYFENDLKNLNIENKYKIQLYVKKITHFCFETLIDIEKYLQSILISIEKKNTYERVESLKDSLLFFQKSITDILEIYHQYDKSILEDIKKLEIKIFHVEAQDDYKENKNLLSDYKDILETIQEKVKVLSFYSYVFYLNQEFKDNQFSEDMMSFFLTDIKKLVEKMFSVQVEIAKNFQTGDDPKAISWLLVFIDALMFIDYLIENMSLVAHKDVNELKFNLKNNLADIEVAFEDKDYVSISDLIEYNLKENLEVFLKLLK